MEKVQKFQVWLTTYIPLRMAGCMCIVYDEVAVLYVYICVCLCI